MNMDKIVIATHNPGKAKEFKRLLQPYVTNVLTLDDLHIDADPPETADTFAQNSSDKALFYYRLTKLPTLADDSGLEIAALNGWPGIHSRELFGSRRSDDELRQLILQRVSQLPEDERSAQLVAYVTLRIDEVHELQARASIEGVIRDSTVPTEPGYPYRAILWLPQIKKYYSELASDEHEQISHRRMAVNNLMKQAKEMAL